MQDVGSPAAASLQNARGPGDPFGTKQAGGRGGLSALCMQELRRAPMLMEHARAAAAEALSSQQLTPRLKAALLAYGFWRADGQGDAGGEGGGKDGISGV